MDAIDEFEEAAWKELEQRQAPKISTMEQLFKAIQDDNKRRPVGIMFAMPMFGGMCHGEFAMSMMKSVLFLTQLGYRVNTQAMYNESLITRARNNLAATFMKSDMDLLMFLDSDIVWEPMDILKLILADREFCGGVYPRKVINWTGVAEAARAGKDHPEDWSCSYLFKTATNNGEADDDGMLEVTHAATGFLLLKRSVFERLMPFVPVYEDVVEGEKIHSHDFFRVGVGENGKYTSEDYWFCNEWRKVGGRIWINPFIRLGHIGTHQFNGNLARMGSDAF